MREWGCEHCVREPALQGHTFCSEFFLRCNIMKVRQYIQATCRAEISNTDNSAAAKRANVEVKSLNMALDDPIQLEMIPRMEGEKCSDSIYYSQGS